MSDSTKKTAVSRRAPSSASATQSESAPEVEKTPLSLEEAVRVLLPLVHDHRTAGDSDLRSALDDVEAALEAS